MSKKADFSPEEWDSLNAILTEAIAVAYPELGATPYNREPASKDKEKGGVQCHLKQS